MKNSVNFDDYLFKKLKDKEFAKEFINASLESYLEDNDFAEFARSLELVIKANESVSKFAREAGLNRGNLYGIFNNKKKPQFDTIITILSKLGFRLKIA
ncbi:MAG: transcriptional regulator [bacterium]